MSALYKRSQISDTIGYHEIIDPKFKTNTIKIRMMLPLDPNRAAAYALGTSLLFTSTRKYPSIAAFSRKMNRLYGAHASMDTSKLGDFQTITMNFSALHNRYALEQEDILGELLTIMTDCLFDPNLEDGGFTQKEYAIKVKDLLDTIDAEINNKRGYALRQASRLAYKDEPVSYCCYGTREDVLALTPRIAYEAYQELLHTAVIEIFFVGPEKQPRIAEVLSKAFAQVERCPKKIDSYVTPSPLKPEPVTQVEQMNVAQCKMVLAFKTDRSDYYTLNFMSFLYGATPFSLLFTNVREKMSLCYYCNSSYSDSKQTLFVDCGVEKSNIETAKAEILHQLETVRKGEFSDELLENTRTTINNTLLGIGDTPSSHMRWYFSEMTRNSSRTPQQVAEIYQAVTREQIMEAAASMKLDCIYIMEATGEEASANE